MAATKEGLQQSPSLWSQGVSPLLGTAVRRGMAGQELGFSGMRWLGARVKLLGSGKEQ